jgi:uncharacterized protein (DUF1015 family)
MVSNMALIRPFRGVIYNQRIIDDPARASCPPYDIISPPQQDELYDRDEYNFVRIEYNRETPQDTARDSRYTRAAANITTWIEQKVLIEETTPAFYLHDHYFECQGKPLRRRNLIAAVRLEEWESRKIRPHENIIPRAKSDRMSMLRACQANTSAVLAMYRDHTGAITDQLEETANRSPLFDFQYSTTEKHQLWAITDPAIIDLIQERLSGQPLYIADGHHRYDSALTYRRELAAKTTLNGDEGFNYVMMNLIDFADPGLIILPTHRLIKGTSGAALKNLKTRLHSFFEIEELSIDSESDWQQLDARMTSPEIRTARLAAFGLSGDQISVLTLRDGQALEHLMPAGSSALYRQLDVSLVDHVILEGQLSYDVKSENLVLDYTRDRYEAIDRVRRGEYQLALILNPVAPEIIQGIADAGDRMPRKSTYFYPKSPAGLVFYRWREENK